MFENPKNSQNKSKIEMMKLKKQNEKYEKFR